MMDNNALMNTTVEKIWHLEKFNLFKALSMEEKMRLRELTCMEEYTKGDTFYLPSDTQRNIFFLKKGHVKLSHVSEDGEERLVEVIGPGEIFGKYTILENKDEEAYALENCLVCYLPENQWNEFITHNPAFTLSVLKIVGIRFKKLQTRVEELQFLDSSTRVRKVLKDLADHHGRKIGVGYEVELRLNLTHNDIAKLAGTSRQTVTTEFRRLEQKNILTYDRRRILVKKDSELWE